MGETGTSIVRVHIDEEGKVLEIQLRKSSGYDRLDQAALDGIRKMALQARHLQRHAPAHVGECADEVGTQLKISQTGKVMDSQFGIAHVWAQGDFVTKAVAVILIAMSLASWIVIIIKALDVCASRSTRAMRKTSGTAPILLPARQAGQANRQPLPPTGAGRP